jgi:arylformamidase
MMIDITRSLCNGHPNWPGDIPFELVQTASIHEGSSVNIMSLKTSNHCGTHIDAPFHYLADGPRLGSIPLTTLIGRCLVIDAQGYEAVPDTAIQGANQLPERILFHTGQPESWTNFPEFFTPLTPQLVYRLAEMGVKLVGTDSPSVDAFSSKALPVHQAFAETGLIILEGLNLSQTPAGEYDLICLPLAMPDADASPVRAILR